MAGATNQRKRKMRQTLIDALAGLESQEFPARRAWLDLLPKDPPPDGFTKSMMKKGENRKNPLYEYFSGEELDEIQTAAVRKKIANMGDKAAHVLEKFYEAAVNGDTAAGREFLTRVLGSPTQKVKQEMEVGSNLKTLLDKLSPADAYARPTVDSAGNEIIDIHPEEQVVPDMTESKQEELPDGSQENSSD